MDRRLTALALAGAAATAGCGSQAHDQSVAVTVQRYLSAVYRSGDFEVACEQLAPAARGDVVRSWNAAVPSARTSSCEATLRRLVSVGSLDRAVGGVMDDDKLDAAIKGLPNVAVGDIEVHGDSASARVEGSAQRARFVRVGGGWKVARVVLGP